MPLCGELAVEICGPVIRQTAEGKNRDFCVGANDH